MERRVIGIDLGTTYSMVTIREADHACRHLGRDIDETTVEADRIAIRESRQEHRGAELTSPDLQETLLTGTPYSPELASDVGDAVIMVPAYFSVLVCFELSRALAPEEARVSTESSSQLALEAVAAAACYMNLGHVCSLSYLVFDLGGGTFDCTIVRVKSTRVSVTTRDCRADAGYFRDGVSPKSMRSRVRRYHAPFALSMDFSSDRNLGWRLDEKWGPRIDGLRIAAAPIRRATHCAKVNGRPAARMGCFNAATQLSLVLPMKVSREQRGMNALLVRVAGRGGSAWGGAAAAFRLREGRKVKFRIEVLTRRGWLTLVNGTGARQRGQEGGASLDQCGARHKRSDIFWPRRCARVNCDSSSNLKRRQSTKQITRCRFRRRFRLQPWIVNSAKWLPRSSRVSFLSMVA